MKCMEARQVFPELLDGVAGRSAREAELHAATCSRCHMELQELRRTRALVSALGRVPAPPDLQVRLRVAISQQANLGFRHRVEALVFRFENAVNSMLVPATAGVLTAIIFFGLIIGFFALPAQLEAANDVPLNLVRPAQLRSIGFEYLLAPDAAEGIVVEALIDANGRVQEYKVVSSPDGSKELSPKVKNMLLFTVFEPAMTFGRPTSTRVYLSFSNIDVQG